MLAAKSASVSLKASTARPALPCRAAFSRPCVRAQATQSESDVVAQVSKAAALSVFASSWLTAGQASAATELAQVAASDGRLGTIATLFVPVIGWVGFNILQPTLSQLAKQADFSAEVAGANSITNTVTKAKRFGNKLKKRSVVGAIGAGGAALSLLSAEQANAATELAQVAASDGRLGVIGLLFLPVLGWVAFNIAQPALNQIAKQAEFASDGSPKPAQKIAKKAVRKVFPKKK